MSNKKFSQLYDSERRLCYRGATIDSEPNGYGESFYANGVIKYRGEWKNGVFCGKGSLYSQDGNLTFEGSFVDGMPVQKNDQMGSDESLGDLENAIAEINEMIGLHGAKQEIFSLVNFAKVQKERLLAGLPCQKISSHIVFSGNPGTGKTTVARHLAKIYFHLGYLSRGHLIETDRAGLVAGYVGQTAIKVESVLNKAIGGVLFIDEAYSLSNEDGYGNEAIDALLKRMEDHRDDLVVIAAGYPEEMKEFINANPGLKSRFTKYIDFSDYSTQELCQIFESMCKGSGYNINELANSMLVSYFDKKRSNANKSFGNGRFVRNIYELIICEQANRLASTGDFEKNSLSKIVESDVKLAISKSDQNDIISG